MNGQDTQPPGQKRKRRPKKPFIPAGAAPYLHTFSSTSSAAPLRRPKQTPLISSEPPPNIPISTDPHSQNTTVESAPQQKPDTHASTNGLHLPIASNDADSGESFDFPAEPYGLIPGSHSRTADQPDYPPAQSHGSGHLLRVVATQGYLGIEHRNEGALNTAGQAITASSSSLIGAESSILSSPHTSIAASKADPTINVSNLHSPFGDMHRRLREAATESAYIALASRMQSLPSSQPLSLPSIEQVVGQQDVSAAQCAMVAGSGNHLPGGPNPPFYLSPNVHGSYQNFSGIPPHSYRVSPPEGLGQAVASFPSKTNWKSGPGNIDLYQHGLYFALLENSPVPTLVCENEKVLYANKAVCHLFGYLEPELLRMGSISDFVDPSERDAFQKFWIDSSKSVDIVQSVRRCVHKIGYAITCLWRCRTVNGQNGSVIIASIQDILQAIMHMRLDRPLSEVAGCSTLSSEIFRDAFVFSHGALAIIGSTDRFLHVNITFCDLLGYTRQELIEKYWYELLPWDEVKTSRVKMKQCRQSSTGRGEFFECRCLKKSGSYNPLMMRFSIMKNARSSASGQSSYVISELRNEREESRA